MERRIGFLVNPMAGIGGRVGLKGSDGEDIVKEALARGGKQEAPFRAETALQELLPLKTSLVLLTAAGSMGQAEAEKLGFQVEVVYTPCGEKTAAADTEQAAAAIMRAGGEVLLFAGGDGTARNICKVVQCALPVVGIPAGVKIHSAVYGISPKGAGQVLRDFLEGKTTGTRDAEVMDLDEALYREGVVSPKLYGYMTVPADKKGMQNRKARSMPGNLVLDFIATDIIETMQEDVYYMIGAGTTTRNIMEILKLENTLIGVDVIKNKKLVVKDAGERELLSIVKSGPCRIVVTAIGGQGHIFGRGNQQFSPQVIRAVGKDNITIVATKEKLLSLEGRKLLVDTGDVDLDEELSGYWKIITGLGERVICGVVK